MSVTIDVPPADRIAKTMLQSNTIEFFKYVGEKEFYYVSDVLNFFWIALLRLAARADAYVIQLASDWADEHDKSLSETWHIAGGFGDYLTKCHAQTFQDSVDFSSDQVVGYMFPNLLTMRFDRQYTRLGMKIDQSYVHFVEQKFRLALLSDSSWRWSPREIYLWQYITTMRSTLLNGCFGAILHGVAAQLSQRGQAIFWNHSRKHALNRVYSIAGDAQIDVAKSAITSKYLKQIVQSIVENDVDLDEAVFDKPAKGDAIFGEVAWLALSFKSTIGARLVNCSLVSLTMAEAGEPGTLFLLDPKKIFVSPKVVGQVSPVSERKRVTIPEVYSLILAAKERQYGLFCIDDTAECMPMFDRLTSFYQLIEISDGLMVRLQQLKAERLESVRKTHKKNQAARKMANYKIELQNSIQMSRIEALKRNTVAILCALNRLGVQQEQEQN